MASRAAEPDIEGPFSAVVTGGPLIGRDEEAEFRLGEPQRHGTPQHSLAAEGTALAGDHQDMAHVAFVSPEQEIEKQIMLLVLKQAVQLDAGFDRQATFCQLARYGLFKRLVAWRGLRTGWRPVAGGWWLGA